MPDLPDDVLAAPRSPELMSADDTGLLVVDVQEKLIGLIYDHARVVWNIRRLLDGAQALNVPCLATEQYPKGLGNLVTELATRVPSAIAKTEFSCLGCRDFREALKKVDRPKWLVVGIEAHVCIQQSVLDLLSEGLRVYVAVDATGARAERDSQISYRRMESSGATLTTTEAALFEWCQTSGTPQFNKISALIKEKPPA